MDTNELLPGTLEMLILKTLSRNPNHGYGIAQHIRAVSEDSLKIGEGSLYPAKGKRAGVPALRRAGLGLTCKQ